MDAQEELLVSIATSLNVIAKLALGLYERNLSGDIDPITQKGRDRMYGSLEDTTIS